MHFKADKLEAVSGVTVTWYLGPSDRFGSGPFFFPSILPVIFLLLLRSLSLCKITDLPFVSYTVDAVQVKKVREFFSQTWEPLTNRGIWTVFTLALWLLHGWVSCSCHIATCSSLLCVGFREPNKDAVRLVREMRLSLTVPMIRMYRSGRHEPLSSELFAITSLDVCGFWRLPLTLWLWLLIICVLQNVTNSCTVD